MNDRYHVTRARIACEDLSVLKAKLWHIRRYHKGPPISPERFQALEILDGMISLELAERHARVPA